MLLIIFYQQEATVGEVKTIVRCLPLTCIETWWDGSNQGPGRFLNSFCKGNLNELKSKQDGEWDKWLETTKCSRIPSPVQSSIIRKMGCLWRAGQLGREAARGQQSTADPGRSWETQPWSDCPLDPNEKAWQRAQLTHQPSPGAAASHCGEGRQVPGGTLWIRVV